jgi:hypothetical protein
MKLSMTLLSATVVIAALSAQAQEPDACRMSETIVGCWNRMHSAYLKSLGEPKEAEDPAAVITAKTRAAPTALIDPALGNSIKDFLPRFASGFSVKSDKKDVQTFQYNTLPVNGPFGRGRLQLTGIVRPPEPYKSLVDTVAKAQRAAAGKEIADNLRDIDDLDFSIGWNWETKHFGRSFTSHRAALESVLMVGLVRDVSQEDLTDLYVELSRNHASSSACSDVDNVQKWPLSCANPPLRSMIQDTVRSSARRAAQSEVDAHQALDSTQVFTVPFLINNQPQLHFNIGYRRTDKYVGPNQAYGEITYELGRYNMESLYASCRSSMRVLPSCLHDYVLSDSVRAGLRHVSRWSFTLGATRNLEYDAALKAYNVSLKEPASWQIRGKAAWGRFFGVPDSGTAVAKGRIESSFEYVNNTNSAFRNKNRVLGTISYTYRINDDLTLTTGFVAANTSEVRGDVDWPVGVRAGFKYKFAGGG